MATVNRNNVYKSPSPGGVKSINYPVNNSTAAIHQGDMVWLDTSAHLAKALDSDAHALSLVGVALSPTAVTSNLDNGTIPNPSQIMVGDSAIFSMYTTASETYYTGTVVYYGADAQTISVSGTNKVGTVILPEGMGTSALTGAAGVLVPVYIKSILV